MRSEDCIKAVKARWEEELAGNRWLSELPHYRSENFCELPDQIAHREHVAHTLRKRSNFAISLGVSMDTLRVLPTNKAEEIFGAEIVNGARERASGIEAPAPVERIPDERLAPSCFGLPVPVDVSSDRCRRCPLAPQCVKVSQSALDSSVTLYGSDNPHADHVRALTRERVQRFRDKRRRAQAGVVEEGADMEVAA